MKTMLVELDAQTAIRLEAVAPARSRRRSEFIRTAIRRALWDLEERRTADAYRRQPDAAAAFLSEEVWETRPRPKRPGKARRKR
jgi:predicted transcriptional regulator